MTEEESRNRLESLAPAHALGRIGTDEEIAEAAGVFSPQRVDNRSNIGGRRRIITGITNA